MARLTMIVSAALGGEKKLDKYLRFHESAEPEKMLTDRDISFDAFAGMYGAVKQNG